MPIILVIGFFQLVVLQSPIPDLGKIAYGMVMVVIGLTLFIHGLKTGLFPIGESMAYDFARKGSLFWLLLFAFSLGFGTTIAEPALIAITNEAADVAAGKDANQMSMDKSTPSSKHKILKPSHHMIENTPEAKSAYALGLRITVAFSVGLAILIGVLRIIKGWPVQYLIMGGYAGVIIMTFFAPEQIIGIAYDSGAVTTSTITVPLVTSLGIGLASSIKGRNPMIDGFGLIAFASLTPMIFVMGYGIVVLWN